MNLKQLEYFSAVARFQSFSKAARALHVAQPPVSRQIAMLEDELGVRLFIRTNKGVVLTEAGKSLYLNSRHIFQNLQMIADNIRSIDSGETGVLKIGIIYSDTSIVLHSLTAYHRRYPKVELYIRTGIPNDLLNDLDNGDLHVLFLRRQIETDSGFGKRILGEDTLELVMTAQTDPVPERSAVPVQALRGLPMCLLRSDDLWGYSKDLIDICQSSGFMPNVLYQCYDTPMAMQLVQAGFGLSFLPRSIVETQPGSGIYSKPIEQVELKSYPMLVWNDRLYYSTCVKHFISLVCDQAENK